ncbi:unnamed protein product [Euphydryas editha]|uniref:HMG box domain-containing protein n=1 Tax=Euphydryas editha TaxID=104508 RepID=A0AAU9TTQ1_EUPED|nr:unnamed protein product [Euphydryas editha]
MNSYNNKKDNSSKEKKKKASKNAFYYFMIDFRQEQSKKGITYENMQQVAVAADPKWREAHPHEKAKYEAIAKQQKQKGNAPAEKYTSTGIPLSHINQKEMEILEAKEREENDITNLVNLGVCNNSLTTMDIYLMDVNYFCTVGDEYLIGETSLLRFNIQDGIKDTYHEFINPGYIPLGYSSQMREGCIEYGLIEPGESAISNGDYMKVLAHIIDYLKRADPNAKRLPPIFTMAEKVEPVQQFIYQMCERAEEDETIFRVYRLDMLFFKIMNALQELPYEGFPKQSLASMHLKKDSFKYTPGIACEHHEKIDRAVKCTESRVKRWAFSVLDFCCPVAGVRAVPARHVPPDLDLDSIHIYQEQKKERIAPSVANLAVNTKKEKEKRVHVPLRMPKTDYSQSIRVAPDLTEAEFPKLGAPRAGRGPYSPAVKEIQKEKIDSNSLTANQEKCPLNVPIMAELNVRIKTEPSLNVNTFSEIAYSIDDDELSNKTGVIKDVLKKKIIKNS